MKIAELGAGAWGTALAASAAARHEVLLWARDAAQVRARRRRGATRGGGEVIVQKDLTPSKLAAEIQRYARGEGGTPSPLQSTAAEEIVRACKHHVQKD